MVSPATQLICLTGDQRDLRPRTSRTVYYHVGQAQLQGPRGVAQNDAFQGAGLASLREGPRE